MWLVVSQSVSRLSPLSLLLSFICKIVSFLSPSSSSPYIYRIRKVIAQTADRDYCRQKRLPRRNDKSGAILSPVIVVVVAVS